jgi:hypothetical protein
LLAKKFRAATVRCDKQPHAINGRVAKKTRAAAITRGIRNRDEDLLTLSLGCQKISQGEIGAEFRRDQGADHE